VTRHHFQELPASLPSVFQYDFTIISLRNKLFYTACPVSTGMGDHLRVGKSFLYVASHMGRLSLSLSVASKTSISLLAE